MVLAAKEDFMAGSQISTTVSSTVYLGQGGYMSPLTITSTGSVVPVGYGPDGMTGAAGIVGAGTITNQGLVTGAVGAYGSGAGGIAVDGANMVTNAGTVTGGTGGPGYSDPGSGGIGILLASGGTLVNSGAVHGGSGYVPLGGRVEYGGAGGAGVQVQNGVVSNSGLISGGSGGYDDNYTYAPGGVGVFVAGGTLANTGTIVGGAGPFGYDTRGYGGAGVYLTAGASASNRGLIKGGFGEGIGATTNGATLTNMGTLLGVGASGFVGDNAKLTNAGTIGSSGASGAAGVDLTTGTLSNSGIISGAQGFYSSDVVNGGVGGLGVMFSGGTMLNTGIISAGNGGGSAMGAGGQGGDGIELGTGTLITSGTITAGSGGSGPKGQGAAGDAVLIDAHAGTLVVNPGAVFQGAVVASPGQADVLILGGMKPAMLTGLGSEFSGFSNVIANPGSKWTLTGSNVLGPATQLHVAGTLAVAGALTASDGVFGVGRLVLDAHATLTAATSVGVASLAFAGRGALLSVGDVSVTSTLSGFETGDIIDIGRAANTLTYVGDTLTLKEGGTVVDMLHFTGSYTAANFVLKPDGHGGTDIRFVAGDFVSAQSAIADLPDEMARPLLARASLSDHVPDLALNWHAVHP